jgi:putative sterol carrier protein
VHRRLIAVCASSRKFFKTFSTAPKSLMKKPTPVEALFSKLEAAYKPGSVKSAKTFYFSLEDEKWTVTLEPQRCRVERGKTVAQADVVLKTSPDLFVKMWHGEFTPGVGDFLAGRVKANDPAALKAFLAAFQ